DRDFGFGKIFQSIKDQLIVYSIPIWGKELGYFQMIVFLGYGRTAISVFSMDNILASPDSIKSSGALIIRSVDRVFKIPFIFYLQNNLIPIRFYFCDYRNGIGVGHYCFGMATALRSGHGDGITAGFLYGNALRSFPGGPFIAYIRYSCRYCQFAFGTEPQFLIWYNRRPVYGQNDRCSRSAGT